VQIIKLAKREWHYLLALALLSAGLFFFELGRLPLIGRDEPRYTQVAREMFLSGDWITPRLGGIHWFEKPALLYWMVAASYQALGVSEFSSRISIALAASLGALLLFFFGRRLRSARFGYLSAATLLTTGLWVGFGHAASFDLPLAVTMELALLAFFWWERADRAAETGAAGGDPRRGRRDSAWWVCCFALGLALLAKGLVGLLLPAAIIGLYLLLTRGLSRLLARPHLLLLGALVLLATAGVWYGPMLARHGGEFIQEFFIGHHFQRFLSNKYRHPQPFYFFFAIALMGSFPWSLYLVAGAWRAAKRWRSLASAPDERLDLFLWLWVLVPVVFFSFSGSKLPGYILPIFPAVAMIVSRELEGWWSGASLRQLRWPSLGTALLVMIFALGVGWRGGRELGVSAGAAWTTAISGMAMVGGYLALLFWRGGRVATLFLPFGLALIMMVAVHLLLPGLGAIESMRELSQAAARAARPGERLAFYINNEQSVNFYATELPLRGARSELVTAMSPEEVAALLEAQPAGSLLVISLERWSADILQDEQLAAETLGRQERPGAQRSLVLMRVRRRGPDKTP
jgi:4-amino-4-deoxy-L-arabinose transferase-like glycosyltransferase